MKDHVAVIDRRVGAVIAVPGKFDVLEGWYLCKGDKETGEIFYPDGRLFAIGDPDFDGWIWLE